MSITPEVYAAGAVEYGFSEDSRIEAEGKSEVRVWAVNKLSDWFGNYYTISYLETNSSGDYQATRVDNTGNANS